MTGVPQASNLSQASQTSLVDIGEIWRRKWIVLLVTVVAMGCGAAYVAVTPKTFEVQSRVLVREDNPSLETDRRDPADRQFLATQAEIIRSPLILREALDEVHVTLPEGYVKGEVAFVLESLSVTPIIQTDVLKISYRSTDAQQAKDLTATLVEKYREHVQRSDRGRHAEDLELLTRRESELRGQLEELQDEYLRFRSASPLIGQGRETLTVQSDQLAHIGRRLSEARNRRIDLENKLQVFTLARAEAGENRELARILPISQRTPAVASRTVGESSTEEILDLAAENNATRVLRDVSDAGADDLGEIQLQLWQAKTRAKELSQQYGEKHPEMRAAREAIAHWEELLKQHAAAAESGLVQELQAARATEDKLDQLYEDEQDRVSDLDEYLVEEAALTNKIERTEAIYDTLLARLKEYQLTDEAIRRGRSSVTVTMLDGASLQEQVIWPQPKSLLGLCGMLGMVGGVLLVSLRRQTSERRGQ